jgi:hypothetical protein
MGGLNHKRLPNSRNTKEVYAPGFGVNNDAVCPIEKVVRGDILFSIPEAFPHRAHRVNPVSMPDYNVTAASNGIVREMRVQFIGVALNPGIGEGADRTTDNMGAGAVFGIAEVMNNGPETIFPGDLIGASPETWTIESNGTIMPALDEVGQNQQKFRARTFRITSKNILTQLEGIQIRVMNGMADVLQKGLTHRRLDKMANDICDTLNLKFSQPLRSAAFLIVSRRLCHAFMRSEIEYKEDEAAEAEAFIKNSINEEWMNWAEENRKKYDGMMTRANYSQDSGNMFPRFDWGVSNRGEQDWFKRLSAAMSIIDDGLRSVQAFQQDFIHSHAIGIAQQIAGPGQGVDVCLRAH